MININLIPPEDKINYKTIIAGRFTIFFCVGIFIMLAIFAYILAVGYLLLYLQIEPLNKKLATEKATEKFKKVEDFEKQIKDTNAKINLIINIERKSVPILPVIESVAIDSGGKESLLKSVVINSQTLDASIKGFSLTREQVITIDGNLKKNPSLSDIISPYSNFLKQKNVDFEFNFKIKKQ